MVARGTFVEVVARRSFVAINRHRRTVGFIESAMPADGIPRCGFASNGDVGTSRLEGAALNKTTRSDAHPKDLTLAERGTNNSAKTSDPGPNPGHLPDLEAPKREAPLCPYQRTSSVWRGRSDQCQRDIRRATCNGKIERGTAGRHEFVFSE
jgi:hypothetical protein